MDLHDWCLRNRYVTREEFKEIVRQQFRASMADVGFDDEGFVTSMSPPEERGRLHPVGDVIKSMALLPAILERAKVADLDGLVYKWQAGHVEELEPITNFGICGEFGRSLFRQRHEKKLVAKMLCSLIARDRPLVNTGDAVVLPEGTSAFYVGVGLGRLEKRTSVITSNVPFASEYLCNPALAAAFTQLYLIGGHLDFERETCRCERGGVFGQNAMESYSQAIRNNPGATVVVMPVSGLLPGSGPYARTDFVRQLKLSVIEDCLAADVREFIFIADYTKHQSSRIQHYGAPIVARTRWRKLLSEHRDKICLLRTCFEIP